MPAPSRVSVIIVSWNAERFLPDCLDSLAAQTHAPAQVLVVDNGSTDGSCGVVRRRAPSAELIELGENAGFCRANNIALGRVSGEAVLFLNPDVVLDPGFIASALGPFARDERIGSVGGKLLRFDGRLIDTAGQCLARSRRIVERGYGRGDDGRFERGGYVFSVCGAAALYSLRAVRDLLVGGELFDGDFFAFAEDADLGWRARNAGWRAYYEPRAVGRHYRGGSGAEAGWLSSRAAILRRPAAVRCHILRNRYLMILKNDSVAHLLRDVPFVAAREAALAAVVLASGPAVLGPLLRSGDFLRRARRRRREFLATSGVWGRRRCGLPSAWAGERLLENGPDGRADHNNHPEEA